MSIALKYTTLKDAAVPLQHFRSEKKYNGKTYAVILMITLAVALPLFFLYALIGPQGYRPWSIPQGNAVAESSFLEEYASSPVPTPSANDYLASH